MSIITPEEARLYLANSEIPTIQALAETVLALYRALRKPYLARRLLWPFVLAEAARPCLHDLIPGEDCGQCLPCQARRLLKGNRL